MSSAPAKVPVMASIGDQGVLNKALSDPLSEIWIDRDLGWLDFNERVLAEALANAWPEVSNGRRLVIAISFCRRGRPRGFTSGDGITLRRLNARKPAVCSISKSHRR